MSRGGRKVELSERISLVNADRPDDNRVGIGQTHQSQSYHRDACSSIQTHQLAGCILSVPETYNDGDGAMMEVQYVKYRNIRMTIR